ncbi:hypothetical protein PMIN04_001869 [Paraphaeosphaeria minitans]
MYVDLFGQHTHALPRVKTQSLDGIVTSAISSTSLTPGSKFKKPYSHPSNPDPPNLPDISPRPRRTRRLLRPPNRLQRHRTPKTFSASILGYVFSNFALYPTASSIPPHPAEPQH